MEAALEGRVATQKQATAAARTMVRGKREAAKTINLFRRFCFIQLNLGVKESGVKPAEACIWSLECGASLESGAWNLEFIRWFIVRFAVLITGGALRDKIELIESKERFQSWVGRYQSIGCGFRCQ